MGYLLPKGRRFIGPADAISRMEKARHKEGVEKAQRKKGGQDIEVGAPAGYQTLADKRGVRQGRLAKSSKRYALLSEGETAFLTDGHSRVNMRGVTFADEAMALERKRDENKAMTLQALKLAGQRHTAQQRTLNQQRARKTDNRAREDWESRADVLPPRGARRHAVSASRAVAQLIT